MVKSQIKTLHVMMIFNDVTMYRAVRISYKKFNISFE